MSSVSPYSGILWVTATVSIAACVQQMVPETRRSTEKAPSRGMRYLVNHTRISCCHKKHVITSSYAYTLKQGRAEKRRHHTHPWIYGSRVGAWLGTFSVLQYATADGCGGQSPINRRSSEHDNMHAWYIRLKIIPRVCSVRYRYSRYRYGCHTGTEVFGTGIDIVPNLPKCPVPVLTYRTYRSVR